MVVACQHDGVPRRFSLLRPASINPTTRSGRGGILHDHRVARRVSRHGLRIAAVQSTSDTQPVHSQHVLCRRIAERRRPCIDCAGVYPRRRRKRMIDPVLLVVRLRRLVVVRHMRVLEFVALEVQLGRIGHRRRGRRRRVRTDSVLEVAGGRPADVVVVQAQSGTFVQCDPLRAVRTGHPLRRLVHADVAPVEGLCTSRHVQHGVAAAYTPVQSKLHLLEIIDAVRAVLYASHLQRVASAYICTRKITPSAKHV